MKKEKIIPTIAPMYICATEMVGSYYSRLSVKNKRVLTVCGSGDQVLNAYSLGAKEVIAFDLNKRSEFITRLKISAVKTLNYYAFLKFFDTKSTKVFDYSIYKIIRSSLDKKTSRFFNALYKKYRFNGKVMIKSKKFFRQRGFIYNSTKIINYYSQNKKEYLKLRAILESKQFKFVNCDFVNLYINKKSLGKFNVINLSNIPNYIFGRYAKKHKITDPFNFFCNKLNELRTLLLPGGLLFYYSYTKKAYWNRISKSLPPPSRNYNIQRMRYKLKYNIYQLNFKSAIGVGLDKIIVLQM